MIFIFKNICKNIMSVNDGNTTYLDAFRSDVRCKIVIYANDAVVEIMK